MPDNIGHRYLTLNVGIGFNKRYRSVSSTNYTIKIFIKTRKVVCLGNFNVFATKVQNLFGIS